MRPERWAQVEEIVRSIVDSEPANRPEILDRVCGDDAELRHEVESLLAVGDQTGFTRSPAFEDAMRVLEHRAAEQDEGRRIGPYRVIAEIGRGGMGTVYRAARADEAFDKLVAVKVIRRGLDTDDIIQRFRAERQILAMLDHPNIARLLDGGSTSDGSPYFVMEYIEGEPLDQYCDRHNVTVPERLKLFQGVCSAVSYAHQNLVIHRDIKPANVLVTRDGVPRLLDFGIAKLLTDSSAPAAGTITALHPLTPEYASPEQIRCEPITTASDVYSLGVLLYRLLTGLRPYRGAMSTPAEIERTICVQEPERPSSAVIGNANARAEERLRLSRRLQGDLDTIVLKALRKEPSRRYSSVEQFSEDIRRHLDGLPVRARPDTAPYRTVKFIARHKVGVSFAALFILVLSGGIIATAWQARVAAAERDRARVEKVKAERINAFLQDMLSYTSPAYGSPNTGKNPDAKVSEVVEQAGKRAETELADQPEVLAEVLRTLGGVYVTQGHYDQAERLLRRALETYKRVYGEGSPGTVEAANALANALLPIGKAPEAEALFRRSIEIERNAERSGHLDSAGMAYSLGGYGGMLDQRGDAAAADYLRQALPYAQAFVGKDRGFVAMLYNNLSHVAYRKGDLKEAERLGRVAIDEYRKLPPGTYVEMAVSLSNLGAVLILEGRYSDAEPFVREGLDLRRKVLGDSHPDTAMGWHRLSDLLYHEGDYRGAEQASQTALEVFGRVFPNPESNVMYAAPLTEIGMIWNKQGRAKEAEAVLRRALGIRSRLLTPGNQLIALTQAALGESLVAQKRYAEAEALLAESYRCLKATAGDGDPRTKEVSLRLNTLREIWRK